ncbi:hypothetical protein M6B38_199405 [Iris pallida]|uniref:Uncharacterized protein n=1 Tax=Iris pallida TaxID=29817 RepID=A0AAX6EAP7_IRIPA|nr:hypothetical protein M6B38_199405 [Iris pallida]
MRRTVSDLTRRGHLMASNVDDRTVARCSGKGEGGRVLILFIDRPWGKPRSGRAETADPGFGGRPPVVGTAEWKNGTGSATMRVRRRRDDRSGGAQPRVGQEQYSE